jgi:hypothetical protein
VAVFQGEPLTLEQAAQLWNHLYSVWPGGSVFRFFSRSRDGITNGWVIDGPEALVSSVKWAEGQGHDCYVQLNPTRKRIETRCTTADITHWQWFLLDIDPVEAEYDCRLALETAEYILTNYLGIKTLHRLVIDSGRGLQAWYPLEPLSMGLIHYIRTKRDADCSYDEIMVDPFAGSAQHPTATVAQRTMSYWLNFLKQRLGGYNDGRPAWGCTVDVSVSDLPRVMRLPYTVNQKTGRRGGIVEDNLAPNVALREKLIRYAPYDIWKEVPAVQPPSGTDANSPWQAFVPAMTVRGRIFVTEGVEEPGRHHAAVAACRSLRELGCGRDEALKALVVGGLVCTPILEERECRKIVDRNYGMAGSIPAR